MSHSLDPDQARHCVGPDLDQNCLQSLIADDTVGIEFIKETKSATMNIFRIFLFSFKSFVKVELSYVFTKNLFTIAENCTEK